MIGVWRVDIFIIFIMKRGRKKWKSHSVPRYKNAQLVKAHRFSVEQSYMGFSERKKEEEIGGGGRIFNNKRD